jgi:Tfp pilus assembly protein PilN
MKILKLCVALLALADLSFAESLLVQDSAKAKTILLPMLPSNVRIDTVTLRELRSVVSGTASSNTEVSNFMRRIDSSTVFSKLELENIEQKDGRVQFVLSAELHCPVDTKGAKNPCEPSTEKRQSIYKCEVAGSTVFQSTPCKSSEPK